MIKLLGKDARFIVKCPYLSVGSISLHNLGTFLTFVDPYLIILMSARLERIYPFLLTQWRSSEPKSGGGAQKNFSRKVKSKKKKKKKKVTAAFRRMIGYL